MRILVHSYVPIYPYFDGAGLRLYNLTPGLVKDFECDLIQERWPWEEHQVPLMSGQGSDKYLMDHYQQIWNIHHHPKERPNYRWVYQSEYFRNTLQERIKNGNYDAIFSGNDTLPIYIKDLSLQIPLIIGGTDSMHLHFHRSVINSKDILTKGRTIYRWANYLLYESRVLRNVQYWVMVSDADVKNMKSHLRQCKFAAIPNGVDVEFFSNPQPEKYQPRTILFVGTLGEDSPNEVALEWFIRYVWKEVVDKLENVNFSIVGPRCSTRLKSVCEGEKNISLLNYVPDVRPYYWSSGIFILPMQSGSGIKNKALEAWASGCAILSTSLGMDGIKHAMNGQNVLIADKPAEFSQTLIDLINHPEIQRVLGKAGRITAIDYYSWDKMGSELGKFICQAIAEQKLL